MAFKLFLPLLLSVNVVFGKSIAKSDTSYPDATVSGLRNFLGDDGVSVAEKYWTVVNNLLNNDNFVNGMADEFPRVYNKFIEIYDKAYSLINAEITEFRSAKKRTSAALKKQKGLPEDIAKFFEIAKKLDRLFKKEFQLIAEVVKSIFHKATFSY